MSYRFHDLYIQICDKDNKCTNSTQVRCQDMSKDVTLGLILPLTHWNFGQVILDLLSLRGLRIIFFSCSAMSNSLQPQELHHTEFPVLYCLPEFAQTHVHCFEDAIQPSHPLLPPSPALDLSQHQGLFQWVSSLPMYWSFSFSISSSNEYSLLTSLLSKEL